MTPGAGAKPRDGSSAFSRTSIAWPRRAARPVVSSRSAGRDLELPADDVDSGHELADRVLDLQPRIQLDEVVRPVRREQELERAGVEIADRATGARDACLHRLSCLLVERRRRRLFDQLLMPALDRALALAERQHPAVRVAEHLDLDVPCRRDELLEVDAAVPERRQRLGAGALERRVQLSRGIDGPHALAAAARRGLEEDGIADLGGGAACLVRADRLGAGHERHAGVCELSLRLDFVSHPRHHVRVGADEDEVVVLARTHELRVLGEEAVAWMNGVTSRCLPCRDDRRDLQVALAGGGRADAHCPVRQARVHRSGIGGRIHGDGFDAELVQRANDADRNLAAVRNEDAREHP